MKYSVEVLARRAKVGTLWLFVAPNATQVKLPEALDNELGNPDELHVIVGIERMMPEAAGFVSQEEDEVEAAKRYTIAEKLEHMRRRVAVDGAALPDEDESYVDMEVEEGTQTLEEAQAEYEEGAENYNAEDVVDALGVSPEDMVATARADDDGMAQPTSQDIIDAIPMDITEWDESADLADDRIEMTEDEAKFFLAGAGLEVKDDGTVGVTEEE